MNLRVPAFATLTALALLLLLTTYLALGASNSTRVEALLARGSQATWSSAWKVLDDELGILKQTWVPAKKRFSRWAREHSRAGVEWASLSGRMNLNTVSPFVLALPGFRATLTDVSLEKFVEARSIAGPALEPFYRNYITPAALVSWYTVHSLWNLNTADEVMLEAMVQQRTGSATLGSGLRSLVRSFRENQVPLVEGDVVKLRTAGLSGIDTVVTLEPELDVNEAPEALLSALISNPAWSIVDPVVKVESLVQARDESPWTPQTLRALLNVPQDHLILSYLGTSSRFLTVSVASEEGTLSVVLFLSGTSGTEVGPRIVETHWRKR